MSPYEILGVPKDATAADIRAAYRRRASAAHPDRAQGDTADMAAVNQARDILLDPERRRRFDETGSTEKKNTVEDEAFQVLAQIFTKVLAAQGTDGRIVALVTEATTELRQTVLTDRESALALQRRLRSKRKLVKSKGPVNIVHGIIDAQVSAAHSKVATCNHMLKVVSAALRMLRDYEDETVPQPAPQRYSLYEMAKQRLATESFYMGGWNGR